MVPCIRVEYAKAQEAKQFLLDNSFLCLDYNPKREDKFISFPVTQDYAGPYNVREDELPSRKLHLVAIPFKDALKKVLNVEEQKIAKTAYDTIGSIAIIEIPDILKPKEKEIANALLNSNHLIETVLCKDGKHDGVFRTQKMKVLAGRETKEGTYRENNCTITVNVEEVYFSARLSTERKRIAQQVKEGEEILVMFSGVAPYPCVLSKTTPAKEIIGIEINPAGHKYGLINIKKNKLTNVKLYCGDVRVVVPTLHQKFDRIIMPLPKTAEEFLDVTLSVAKKDCIIHMYAFYHENEFDKAITEIDKYCKVANREYKILEIVKAGQHAPRTYRICVDFQVLN